MEQSPTHLEASRKGSVKFSKGVPKSSWKCQELASVPQNRI